MADNHDRGSKPNGPLNRLVIIAIGTLVMVTGGLFTWIEARTARKAMHATMMAQALMLAAAFDHEKIAALSGTAEDLTSADYRYLRDQLTRVRDSNPKYRYLYLLGRREGQRPFYFLGTAPEDSEDHSPPGQVYFEASPTLEQVFASRSPQLSPPFTDRWGTWVSALIPVVHPQNGALLAVFGIDVDARDWQSKILRRSMMPALITCLIIVFMGAGAGFLRRRHLDAHVAALRRAETALRESETLFRLQFELGNIGIAITSAAKGWLRANARLCEILGYAEKELMQKTWAEMTHPEDLVEDSAQFDRMLAGRIEGYEMDKRFFRKDGSIVHTHLTVSCHRAPSGTVKFVVASLQDISDRKHTEKALQESQDRFRSMIQSASDMIFILDRNGKISYESPSAARILGYAEGHFLGQSPFALIHPDDLNTVLAEMDLVSRSANSGLPTEFRLKTSDGTWTWLEALASNQYENPSIQGIIITARDISERKRGEAEKNRLNAQLLQAQKMEAVGHLAGGIAHDFNNMLAVVMGYTEMAMINLDPDHAFCSHLAHIHEAAERSAGLVRQLLAFARKQTISPKVLDINVTISGMLVMLRRLIGEDIDLAWLPGRSLGRIRIDPSQIDQILANLMINARDAIAGVGKVTIETDAVVLDEAYCEIHPGFLPGRYVLLAVSDSGCGIDEKLLAQVFEPFFTTKEIGIGTGLGLATVYGIVKQNQGFINVYSEPGKGTSFKIYLPVVDAPENPPETISENEPVSGGTGTVLIVEDDPRILELGRSMLEHLGYSVFTAGAPDQAIALAREHGGKIDLLITDVVMPQMNGPELVLRLNEIIPGLKHLYMSGYTANVIAHHGVLDQGVHFLQKPFSIKEITNKVRQAIKQER